MPHHILIAAMPKSSSTFVANALSGATGFPQVPLVPAFERRQPELCEMRLAENAGQDYIAKHHTRHSGFTERLCDDYGVSVIVLIRSLFDVVVSLRDHVRNKSPVTFAFYLEEQHLDRSDGELEQVIAMLAIPWYVNFYMGWRGCKKAHMVMYEEMIADPNRTIGDMLSFAGVPLSEDQVAAGISKAMQGNSRFNVGKAGRGRSLMPETVSRIMEMLAVYPEIQNDPYIVMMKAQAQDILAARASGAEPVQLAAAIPRPVTSRPVAKPSFFQRVERFIQRKSQLLGSPRKQLAALGLLLIACLYVALPWDLVADDKQFGFADDFIVLAVCAFVAGRILSRIKIKRVAVTNPRGD
jgi:hypothetical protein